MKVNNFIADVISWCKNLATEEHGLDPDLTRVIDKEQKNAQATSLLHRLHALHCRC